MTNTYDDTQRLGDAWDALLFTLGGGAPQLHNPAAEQIPVTVLSGFLGAGKTTLLCWLLEHAQINIVAIVNDIAAVNLDAQLVESTNAETIALYNGCACCVLGSDLRDSLVSIRTRPSPPELIIIETSGLSDPMGVAQTVANVEGLVLDGIVTLVDGLTHATRVKNPVTRELFVRQLEAAHIVVLTKLEQDCDTDLARGEITKIVPGRPIVPLNLVDQRGCDLGPILGVDVFLNAATRGARPTPKIVGHAMESYVVKTLQYVDAVPADQFFALLEEIPASVYRIKGSISVWTENGEQGYDVQAAGPNWRVGKIDVPTCAMQLVIIGAAQEPSFDRFVQAIDTLA